MRIFISSQEDVVSNLYAARIVANVAVFKSSHAQVLNHNFKFNVFLSTTVHLLLEHKLYCSLYLKQTIVIKILFNQ